MLKTIALILGLFVLINPAYAGVTRLDTCALELSGSLDKARLPISIKLWKLEAELRALMERKNLVFVRAMIPIERQLRSPRPLLYEQAIGEITSLSASPDRQLIVGVGSRSITIASPGASVYYFDPAANLQEALRDPDIVSLTADCERCERSQIRRLLAAQNSEERFSVVVGSLSPQRYYGKISSVRVDDHGLLSFFINGQTVLVGNGPLYLSGP